MSDAETDAAPVTQAFCRERHRASVKYLALSLAFIAATAMFLIGWNWRTDSRVEQVVEDHHEIKAVSAKVDRVASEQMRMRNTVDDMHEAVIELKVLIKKNGNH